jgi:hypothetical protein
MVFKDCSKLIGTSVQSANGKLPQILTLANWALPDKPKAGDVVVVACKTMPAGNVTVTDNSGNTYTQASRAIGRDCAYEYWYSAKISIVGELVISVESDSETTACLAFIADPEDLRANSL